MPDIFDEIAGEVESEQGSSSGDVFDSIAEEVSFDPVETPATWGQAGSFVGKSLLTGASKLGDMGSKVVMMPYSSMANLFTKGTIENPITSLFSKGPTQNLVESAVGTPEEVGLTGMLPKVVGAAVEGSVNPFGGPLANAVASAGGEFAHQLFPDSSVAPFIGALAPGAAGSVAKSAGNRMLGYADDLPNLARTLDRKSLQARASDYGKASGTRIIDTPEEGVETFVKSQLDDLLESGKLGTSRAPAKLARVIRSEKAALGDAIAEKISAYDDAVKQGLASPAKPEFESSLNMLAAGKVPADQVDEYFREIENLNDAINTQSKGQGALKYLQSQKQSYSNKWKSAAETSDPKAAFYRSLYDDLKTSVEKYAPEVKGLNQQMQKYMTAEPIVERALRTQEASSPLDISLRRAIFNSVVSPNNQARVARAVDSMAPVVGLAGRAASSPYDLFSRLNGQTPSALMSTLTGGALAQPGFEADPVESVMSELFSRPSMTDDIPKILGAKKLSREEFDRLAQYGPLEFQAAAELGVRRRMVNEGLSEKEALDKTYEELSTKRVYSEKAEKLADSVITQESSGNSKAVSKAGAQGLMQLMPETGKELFKKSGLKGEYDPFDPEQNRILGTMYLEQMLEEFDGDEALALTAYNQGPNRVKKILARKNASSLEEIIPDLGPDGKKYARQVLARIDKGEA